MSQELIFTTLPNRRIQLEGKDFLKLSVFCSIRLTPSQNSTLKSFPDVLSWPEIIAGTEYKFKFGNSEIDAQLLTDQLDPNLFGNIFYDSIKVKSFQQDNFSDKNIHSVPLIHIKDFVLNNYQKLAIESPTKLVTADKFVDTNVFGSINRIKLNEQEISKVNDEKTVRKVQMKTLMNQDMTVDKQVKSDLRKSKFMKFSPQMNPTTDFAQLRQFHRIDAQMKPVKPIVIKKPEFEFHDIVSITTNYPQIARRLGFVLDFIVPFEGSLPVNSIVSLMTENMNFTSSDTVISTPPTAYQLTSNGFYIADKQDSIFKQGFVRINTSQFSVVQMDADGAALKTQQITESKTREVAKFYEVRSEAKMMRNKKFKVKTKEITEPEPPAEEGLPTMRSAGIAIVSANMAANATINSFVFIILSFK